MESDKTTVLKKILDDIIIFKYLVVWDSHDEHWLDIYPSDHSEFGKERIWGDVSHISRRSTRLYPHLLHYRESVHGKKELSKDILFAVCNIKLFSLLLSILCTDVIPIKIMLPLMSWCSLCDHQ